MEPTYDVLESIELQARACEHIGSPLYATLLHRLAEDFRDGGLTHELLATASDRPQHDALPLRYVATAHRLALAGEAPDLARHYPSCGGRWDGQDVSADFLALVATRRDDVAHGLTRQVQTNEVGRAAVLACGMASVAARHGLPLRTLEVGASAGLLSRLPWFRIDTGGAACGPADSALHLGPEWFDTAPPALPDRLDVVEQAAVDLMPIDVATPEGRLSIQSFVWPDQMERMDRLRAALRIAADHPLHVDERDAGDWLGEHLAHPLPRGIVTVVFHSIVWQYLPQATRQAMKAALQQAGERTTAAAPLAWLRMEPAAATHADLRLTTWPGGETDVLAEVGYHGHHVRWLR